MRFWDNRYEESKTTGSCFEGICVWNKDTLRDETKKLYDEIDNVIDKNEYKSVIDYGCGRGRFYSYFNKQKYTGLDLVPAMIDDNKNRFSSGIWKLISEYKPLGEYNKIEFESGEIKKSESNGIIIRSDLIFCFTVLQHEMTDDGLRKVIAKFEKWGKSVFICETAVADNAYVKYRTNDQIIDIMGYGNFIIDKKYEYNGLEKYRMLLFRWMK